MAEYATMSKDELASLLSAPDAVLGKNVLTLLGMFIKMKGQPNEAVQMLSQGYVGYPAMASLVCDWLTLLTEDDPITGATEMTPSASGADDHGEVHFLSELIKSEFLPETFTSVFKGGPPAWLEDIISHRRGRYLIYDLAAVHTNCLLLSWAIQRILSEGHDAEVAQIGRSLAGYFGVYHRLVGKTLGSSLSAPPGKWKELIAELTDAACQGQHTYAYTQALLSCLAENPNAHAFSCISQEIAAKAALVAGPSVYAMLPMFIRGSGEGEPVHSQGEDPAVLVARLLSASSRSSVSVNDILVITSLYKSANPPPIYFIQHPRLFELLIDAVFTVGARPSPAFQAAAIDLLALAGSLSDEDLAQGEDSPGWQDAATAATSLTDSLKLLRSVFRPSFKGATEFGVVDWAVKAPIAAAALVRAMHACLSQEDFFTETHKLAALHQLLIIALRIIKRHPACHTRLIALIVSALNAAGSAKEDFAKAFLHLLLELLMAGRVAEVLDAVLEWASTADPSLVRAFSFQILANCGPPYSTQFARQILTLMARSNVKRRKDSGQRADIQTDLLTQFASDVSGMHFDPPLEEKENSLLKDIGAKYFY